MTAGHGLPDAKRDGTTTTENRKSIKQEEESEARRVREIILEIMPRELRRPNRFADPPVPGSGGGGKVAQTGLVHLIHHHLITAGLRIGAISRKARSEEAPREFLVELPV